MSVPDYKINYKSDFVLTINSDAGWAVPFCIKFWTGMPSQAYFASFDGENYVNCRVGETPTQLLVMFDDHHMPIGELKMQIAYHTTIEEFPDRKFEEVTNPTNVTVDIDGTEYQVMLDFTGESEAEIDFSMPSSGVMSVNGKIGYVTLNAEDVGAQPTIEDLSTIRSGAAAGATAVQIETDPTVPSWAKEPTKPTYTAEEVGALPDDTSLFSGNYNDLTNKPNIPDALSELSDDSTHRTVTDTEKNTWNGKSDFSGSYNDLTDKPTIPTIPTLATVATSGSYNDLSDKPTIPEAQVQSDWSESDTTSKAFIQNKPTIPTVPSNIVVGDSSSYTIWSGTQAQYDALGTYSNTTLYFITAL